MSESFACVRECVCVKKEKEKKEPSAECGTMSFVYVCVCEREKVGVYNNKQFIGTIEGLYMYVHMYICSMQIESWRRDRALIRCQWHSRY